MQTFPLRFFFLATILLGLTGRFRKRERGGHIFVLRDEFAVRNEGMSLFYIDIDWYSFLF
jgi:hypothetical protein